MPGPGIGGMNQQKYIINNILKYILFNNLFTGGPVCSLSFPLVVEGSLTVVVSRVGFEGHESLDQLI
jgi:hypothetical protein